MKQNHLIRKSKKSNLNPFKQNEIVICSFHFARAKDVYIKQIEWDLIVIDEAHHLRNVYKNTNKIANAIKAAVCCQYCKYATDFTTQNDGKSWKYILIPHNAVQMNMSFEHLVKSFEVEG